MTIPTLLLSWLVFFLPAADMPVQRFCDFPGLTEDMPVSLCSEIPGLPAAHLTVPPPAGLLLPSDMPGLHPSDFPGALFTRNEVYRGSELWGLINGGADLFYEYGFDRMALQEIEWQGEEFRLELYQMNDIGGAFGIYSVLRHNCMSTGSLLYGDCMNRFQYQFIAGNYYLSLINYSGSEKARELSLELGRYISSGMGEPVFPVPDFFRQEGLADHIPRVKMLKGKLGLQNALPGLAEIFKEVDDFTVYYLELIENRGKVSIILLESGSSWDACEIADVAMNDLIKICLDRKQILLFDSSSRETVTGFLP
jgi:hypothetical protein